MLTLELFFLLSFTFTRLCVHTCYIDGSPSILASLFSLIFYFNPICPLFLLPSEFAPLFPSLLVFCIYFFKHSLGFFILQLSRSYMQNS
ncbi:MAG: hypothetical protein J3R72DRAFT_462065 [Linnemannia gamsii]|nr:MAG: hypothetical protein J3R72DRAFT_462065 [Linnemannia gamsii]